MKLCKEILSTILEKEEFMVIFPNLIISAAEMECYKALKKIKTIVEDDSLEDIECFIRIERVVSVLENVGSDGGTRHDFG